MLRSYLRVGVSCILPVLLPVIPVNVCPIDEPRLDPRIIGHTDIVTVTGNTDRCELVVDVLVDAELARTFSRVA